MRLQLGDLFVTCPYCEGTEFVACDEKVDAREVVCASCGGYASRRLLLERLRIRADAAAKADAKSRK